MTKSEILIRKGACYVVLAEGVVMAVLYAVKGDWLGALFALVVGRFGVYLIVGPKKS